MRTVQGFAPVRAFALLLALVLIAGAGTALAGEGKPEGKCPRGESMTEQGCAKNPKLTHKVQPVYPPEARRRHVDGIVTLEAVVTEEGTVEAIKVVNVHATDQDYNKDFANAAVACLSKWRYRPGTLNGKPIPIHFTSVIEFKSGL